MPVRIRVSECEDMSWIGRPMMRVCLSEDRPKIPWRRILVDGKPVEAHFSMPPTNRKLLYINGSHDFTGSIVEFVE